jgi:hypothetical protein
VQALAPRQSRAARLFGRDPIAPDARSWFNGALGELEVARQLDRLGPEWHVVHAIPIGEHGSDIDHLVIGSAGVFTLNAKRHTGRVWVGGRTLMVNGQRVPHLRNAEYEARRVAKILSIPVTPLIVVVGTQRLTIRERPEKVVVLRAAELVRWLSRSTPALAPQAVDEITRRAEDLATWGVRNLPEPDLAAFAELRESRASAERRRVGWGVIGMASAGAVLLSLPLLSTLLSRVLLSGMP